MIVIVPAPSRPGLADGTRKLANGASLAPGPACSPWKAGTIVLAGAWQRMRRPSKTCPHSAHTRRQGWAVVVYGLRPPGRVSLSRYSVIIPFSQAFSAVSSSFPRVLVSIVHILLAGNNTTTSVYRYGGK